MFQVVSQRYLKTSIVITTNRGVAGWGEILGDTTVAAAMLDRLLHRSVVLNLDGDSSASATTTPAPTHSVEPPPAPANRYVEPASQVGSFDEHTWGISVSAIRGRVPKLSSSYRGHAVHYEPGPHNAPVAVMGKPMGMMGKPAAQRPRKTVADLERTTGFEPATLTLAR